MKILFLSSDMNKCGIKKYTQELILQLRDLDKNIDIEVYPIRKHLLHLNELREIIKNNYDIVHIQHEFSLFDNLKGVSTLIFYPCLWITSVIKKNIIVTTLHTIWSPSKLKKELPSYTKNIFVSIILRVYLWLNYHIISSFSNFVISLTDNGEIVLKTEYNLRNILYINHGYFIPNIQNINKDELRHYLHINNYNKIILLFGFAYRSKGYHYVIECMPRILYKIKDTTLIITAGIAESDQKQCKEYLNILRNLTKKYNLENHVIFTGYLNDDKVASLISLADAVVFPYDDRESASGAFATVIAYKKPLVVSNIDIFSFLEDNLDCLKADPKNAIELSEKIINIMTDNELKERLIKNISNIFQKSSIQNSAKQHLYLYEHSK